MAVSASFSVGEAITLAIDAVTGDPASASNPVAQIKKALPNGGTPPAAAPVVASFTVTPRAVSGDIPAGWTLALAAGLSVPGRYVTDFRATVGGGQVVSEPLVFRVAPAVSSGA